MRSIRVFGFALQFSLAAFAWTEVGSNETPRYVNVWKKFVSANTTAPSISTRIHGGEFAGEHQFKHMVFLLVSHTADLETSALTCSASLVNESWVLTAAHCVSPRSRPPAVIAVAGKANLLQYYLHRVRLPFDKNVHEATLGVQERRVQKVHIHPDYTDAENGHDLALLLLDRPFQMNDSVETLPVSQSKMERQMNCEVMGWGLNDYDMQTFRLMYALSVLAQTPEISCSYKKSGPFICLKKGGPGICRGDSGSPLVCDNKIFGVASFSVSYNQNPSCLDQQEEYYSQIYPDLSWMERVIQGKNAASLPGLGILTSAFVLWTIVL